MGWTSYRAIHYKWVGKGTKRNYVIDRKAECDNILNDNMVDRDNKIIGNFEVLKSSMVGSVYYAAAKRVRFATETTPEYSKVFAAIFLTSTDTKDYCNFSYKDMDETMGPYKYDCPKGILDLLTPTDNECANNWRAKCREQLEKKKNPNALSKLPENTVIKVVLPFDTQRYSKGDEVVLTKRKWGRSCKWFVSGTNCYFTSGLMKLLEEDYEIINK